jgi:type I restriction enzyme R subunit
MGTETERFCDIYFKPKSRQSAADHREMNAALDPAVDRFRKLMEENADEAELWRGKLSAFRNLYSFLSQIIPYQDSDLERLYTYLRYLAPKLPRRPSGPQYTFDDDIRLEYYRLQKIAEGSISLKDGTAKPLDGPSEVGSGLVREQPVHLSKLIDVINDRFGTDFTDADQLFFDQIVEAAMQDESLREAAHANPEEKFALVFARVLEALFVERMEQNEDIFARFMNDRTFQDAVGQWLTSQVYNRLNEPRPDTMPVPEMQAEH